jgi:ribosomal subunit interface protein
MTLRVSGKNMDVGEALRGKAQDHIDAVVRKYFDGGYDGHLTLEPEGHGFNAVCSIHLDTGAVLQSEAFGGDAISAYEILSETIAKRLRRYNRKLRSHRGRANGHDQPESAQSYVLQSPEDEVEVEADYSPAVIAETTSHLRVLSVGEAVMQLDMSGSDVVVFRHAGHGGLNVVYRRADGNIGWIDPARPAN